MLATLAVFLDPARSQIDVSKASFAPISLAGTQPGQHVKNSVPQVPIYGV